MFKRLSICAGDYCLNSIYRRVVKAGGVCDDGKRHKRNYHTANPFLRPSQLRWYRYSAVYKEVILVSWQEGSRGRFRFCLVMDPYNTLGVAPTDSFENIRLAYLRRARKCHPDKTGNSSALEFLRVQQAWTIIKNKLDSPDYPKSVNSGNVSYVDLEPRDDGLVYGCRCGDVYEVMRVLVEFNKVDPFVIWILGVYGGSSRRI